MQSFMNQMEENVKSGLVYPYHVHQDKLLGNITHNPDTPDGYHTHDYPGVVRIAYMEPKAFYLSDEDKKYYSQQEIDFIMKVVEDEARKVDEGMVIVNLDLTEETEALLEEFKLQTGMTTEEAVIYLLKKMVEDPDQLKQAVEASK